VPCRHHTAASTHLTTTWRTPLVTKTFQQAACLHFPAPCTSCSRSSPPHPQTRTCAPALAPPPRAPQPPSHPPCPPEQAQAPAGLQLQPHEPRCHRCCHHSLQQAGKTQARKRHTKQTAVVDQATVQSLVQAFRHNKVRGPTPPTNMPMLAITANTGAGCAPSGQSNQAAGACPTVSPA
jgi:hypothetical protein